MSTLTNKELELMARTPEAEFESNETLDSGSCYFKNLNCYFKKVTPTNIDETIEWAKSKRDYTKEEQVFITCKLTDYIADSKVVYLILRKEERTNFFIINEIIFKKCCVIYISSFEKEENSKPSNEIKSENLSFEEALSYLKAGKKLSRKSWDNPNCFIAINHFGKTIPVSDLWTLPFKEHLEKNKIENVEIEGNIMMLGWNNRVVNWVNTPTDLLANDWYLVN